MNLGTIRLLIDVALYEPPDELPCKTHHMYNPYYHLMYLLVKAMVIYYPERERIVCVELGMDEGRGAACFAAASPKAEVYGIDHTVRDPPLFGVLRRYPNITFLHRLTVPALLDQLPSIDILHIDTEHTYDIAKAEFEAYRPGLNPGAVVLFDDLHYDDDGVLRYFSSLPWPKIEDDRLHYRLSREHHADVEPQGYGILLMPD